MAVGLAIGTQGGQYNGKMTPFVILSCMMAAMGGVIFGYDIGISGLSLYYVIIYEQQATFDVFFFSNLLKYIILNQVDAWLLAYNNFNTYFIYKLYSMQWNRLVYYYLNLSSMLWRWCDFNGAISKEILPRSVYKDERRQKDKQLLQIR